MIHAAKGKQKVEEKEDGELEEKKSTLLKQLEDGYWKKAPEQRRSPQKRDQQHTKRKKPVDKQVKLDLL